MTKISPSLFKPLTKIMLTQVRPPSADKEMKEMEVFFSLNIYVYKIYIYKKEMEVAAFI